MEGYYGVHSIVTPTGELNAPGVEDDGARAVTTDVARAMKYYGAPDVVIGKMVTTPGSDMAWLTYDDLIGWAYCAEEHMN